jgi:hypothetical protein
MRDAVLVPLRRDGSRQAQRPVASFTQRATLRFEDIALHRQLGVLPPQPHQLRALILAQDAVPGTPAAPVQVHLVPQRPLVDAQLPGHLRDRPASPPDNPDRAFPEIVIELPP